MYTQYNGTHLAPGDCGVLGMIMSSSESIFYVDPCIGTQDI